MATLLFLSFSLESLLTPSPRLLSSSSFPSSSPFLAYLTPPSLYYICSTYISYTSKGTLSIAPPPPPLNTPFRPSHNFRPFLSHVRSNWNHVYNEWTSVDDSADIYLMIMYPFKGAERPIQIVLSVYPCISLSIYIYLSSFCLFVHICIYSSIYLSYLSILNLPNLPI